MECQDAGAAGTSTRQTGRRMALCDFYIASPKAAPSLGIVRGLNVYSLAQIAPELNSAELVKAALAGYPQGTYRDSRSSIKDALDSGPAPRIDFLEKRPEIARGAIHLTVKLTDIGGGIGGKLTWRVRSMAHPEPETQGRIEPEELKALAAPMLGRTVMVGETLHIDPSGPSVVEVFAFNGRGMVATPPISLRLEAPTLTGTLPR